MPEKRLALLCQHFYPEMTSTGLLMSQLGVSLARRGWRLTAYCSQPTVKGGWTGGPQPKRDCYEGVEIYRVQPKGQHEGGVILRLVFAVSYVIAAAWRVLLDRRKLEGLIITTNPPFVGLLAVTMKRLFGLRYALIVHDVYPDVALKLGVLRNGSIITRTWEWMTRLILAEASILVVLGRDMERIIRQKLLGREAPIAIIPNWSDEKVVRPIPRGANTFIRDYGSEAKLIVQYAGNMGRTHNLEGLVQAAKLLRGQSGVLFQFVGDGAKRSLLERMVKEAGLKNVQFLPYQPVSRLAETLSAADLAVVVLERELTGLSVPSKTYGIMAAGVPILAIVDPSSEIALSINEYKCGVVLLEGGGDAIAAVIRDLLEEPERFGQMGRNGRRAFLEHYTLSGAAEQYDRVLTMMVGTGARDTSSKAAFNYSRASANMPSQEEQAGLSGGR